MKHRIGIMGGTFDPIHYGHLVLAEYIKCEFVLDKIVFIPTGIPPHKIGLKISSNDDRYEMTSLAIASNPDFEISDIEMNSKEISYTINTLRKLKSQMDPETELFFITGADAIFDLEFWKDVDLLLASFHIIAGTRPGHKNRELDQRITMLNEKYHSDIQMVEIPDIAVSSTDIRNRVREGKTVKYLVPESIEKFIIEHGLYKGL